MVQSRRGRDGKLKMVAASFDQLLMALGFGEKLAGRSPKT